MTLLAALLLLAMAPLFFGRFYATGDLRDVFIPLESFFRNEQLELRLPVWQPDAAWGYPVLAAAQLGFYYPPLLLSRSLPLPVYFSVLYLTHLLFLGLGTWLFLRRLQFSRPAAFLGALSFALSGSVFQHLTHANIFFIIAWLPWQLLIADYASSLLHRRRPLLFFSVAIAIPFLAGQIQMPLLMAVVSILFFWHRCRSTRQNPVVSALALVSVGLFSLLLSCAQLLPTLELARLSDRSAPDGFDIVRANQHSFPLYHLPTAIFPRFFGANSTYWGKRLEIEYGFFIGTLPLLLAIYGALKTNRQTTFFRYLALISFLLALGSLSPFRLLGLEPSLWLFSAPARWLLFTTFAGAVLVAAGFDRVVQTTSRFPRFLRISAITLISVVAAANIVLWTLPASTPHLAYRYLTSYAPSVVANRPSLYYLDKLSHLISGARTSSVSLISPYTWLPLVILALVAFAPLKRRAAWYAALSAIELVIVAASASPAMPWRDILSPPATLAALPASVLNKQARLLSLPPEGDTGAIFSNPASLATDATRRKQKSLLLPLVNTMFHIPGVSWPASLDLAGHAEKLDTIRAGLAAAPPDYSSAADSNIGAVLSLSDQKSAVVSPLPFKPRAEIIGEPGVAIAYREIAPTKIRLDIPDNQGGILLVRNSYYPGWSAWVDGKTTAITPAGKTFFQLSVPAGARTVTLQYQPASVSAGLTISLITLLIIIVSLVLPDKTAISAAYTPGPRPASR